MHILFLDDAGTISPSNKIESNHFVLAGPVIPEDQWSNLEKNFYTICDQFNVCGEIKWRFFGQKRCREDDQNTLFHLDFQQRDELRKTLFNALIANESIKIISVVVNLPLAYTSENIKKPEDVHAFAYRSIVELYQLHLQQLSQITGSTVYGIIVSDHRNPTQDTAQRNLHREILKSKNNARLTYPNLIEGLFFSPSHHSMGIQFADLISGAVFRNFEHRDDRWHKLIQPNFWKPETVQSEILMESLGYKKEKTLSQSSLST
jgi:uncharacterized protein DUF3800